MWPPRRVHHGRGFVARAGHGRRRRPSRRRILRIEILEVRTLLAVMPLVSSDGVQFLGAEADDSLFIRANAANLLEYSTDGTRYTSDLGGGFKLDLTKPFSIIVDLGEGANQLAIDASLAAALNASDGGLLHRGSGRDTLAGPRVDSTWTVTAMNAGTLNDRIRFTGVSQLLGAENNEDVFVFAAGAGISGGVDGGAAGFDSLVFEGVYETARLAARDASSGSVEYDGQVVEYSGLEPISIAAADVIVTGSPTADAIVVQPSGPGMLEVASPATMETITFPVPTGSLTIAGAAGLDTVTFVGTIAMPGADLFVDAEMIIVGAGTTIDTTNPAGPDGDIVLTAAATAGVPAVNVATAIVDVDGATILAGNLTMTATATATGAASQGLSQAGGQISLAAVSGDARVLVVGSSLIVTSGDTVLAAESFVDVTATTTADPGGNDAIDAAAAAAQAASSAVANVGGDTVLTAAGSLSISATNTVGVTLEADGVAGGSTAAGASVARAVVEAATQAVVGGDAVVEAASIHLAATTATDIAATAKATAKGATGNDATTKGDLVFYGAATSDGAITLAGAFAITDVTSLNRAAIDPASTVTATSGAVSVTATAATATAATADGSTTKADPTGVGVAVAINVAKLTNEASVGGTVTSTGLEVRAGQPVSGGNDFKAKATSGTSDAAKVGVAGSFALNSVGLATRALLEPQAVVTAGMGAVVIEAAEASATETTAEAKVSGDPSLAGVGASVAIAKEAGSVLAAILDDGSLAGVSDLTVAATASRSADTSASGGATGGKATAASVALNFIDRETGATIGTGATIAADGAVVIAAAADGGGDATADGTAAGGTAAVGAAIAITVASDATEATTLRDIATTGPVSLSATTGGATAVDAKASAKGAAGSTATKADDQAADQLAVGTAQAAPSAATSDGKVGVAAAIGLALVEGRAEARIPAGVTVASGGAVTVAASNDTDSAATADGTAASGATGSVGVAVAINKPTVVNRATIGGTVTGTRLDVWAGQPSSGSDDFKAAATSGVSDATKVGVAGSFALNSVALTTQALLEPTAVATLAADADVTIRAGSATTAVTDAKAAVKFVQDGPPTETSSLPDSITLTATADLVDATSVIGTKKTVGVGASVALGVLTTNLTQAEAQDGAVIAFDSVTKSPTGRSLTIAADSARTATTTAEAGVAGGVALSPVVAITLSGSDTTARLGTAPGAPLPLSEDAEISAISTGSTTTTAGATAAGSAVAVGAAVGVTVANDTTQARLARDLTAGGRVLVTSRATTPGSTEAKASAKGGSSGGRTADAEADEQVNDNPNTAGQSLPSAGTAVTAASGTAKANADQGSSGVGVAAAVAVHTSITTNTAAVAPGVNVLAGGTVTLAAIAGTAATAKATGTSLAGNATANIGAAVAIGTPTVTNEAVVGAGAEVSGRGITIEAAGAPGETADFVVWGLAATNGKDQLGVAGSVAVNKPRLTTRASTGPAARLISLGDITIRAAQAVGLQSVAAAGGLTGGVGVGAAVAVNDLAGTTEAFIGTGGHADATEAILVSADTSLVPLTVSIPKIGGGPQVSSVALAGSISTGQVGIAGSVVVDTLSIATRAFIGEAVQVNATAAAGGNQRVSVTATDSTRIASGAGGFAGTTGVVGIGVGVDVKVVNKDTRAFIAPLAVVRAARDVAVLATSSQDVLMIAASAGVALGGVAVGGAVAVFTLNPAADSGTRATIAGGGGMGATVIAGGNVTVAASENTGANSVQVIAGGLAFGSTAGVGGSVARLTDTGTVEALVDRDVVVQAGGGSGVAVTAARRGDLKTFAVGGAGAGTASVAGASAQNLIANIVAARVAAAATVTATRQITISAQETASIQAWAGGVAGAGGLGVGAAVARNDVFTAVTAAITSATVTSTLGRIDVEGTSTATVKAFAVGGAGAGSFAAGGSVASNMIGTAVRAEIAAGGQVTARGRIGVAATSTPTSQALAGGFAGAAGAAIGAAVATNSVYGLTLASIGGGRKGGPVTAPLAAVVTSTADAIQVAASWIPSVKSLAVGGVGAGAFAAGGSVATNVMAGIVDAGILEGGAVSAAGLVTVAASMSPANCGAVIEALAGGVVGAGAAAVGAAVATNTIGNAVVARVETATVASGTGSIRITSGGDPLVRAIAVGGQGAGTFAAGGSVAVNTFRDVIDAHVFAAASLTAPVAINVAATAAPVIRALAGNVAGAGAVAIGAGVATNDMAATTTASIDGSSVVAGAARFGGSVGVTANATPRVETIALGGAGAAVFAAGGSVATMTLANVVDARIATAADVTAGDAITVSAVSTTSVDLTAGAAAGAIVAAGAGIATATVNNRTDATATGGAVLRAESLVEVGARGQFSRFQVDAYIGGGGIVALDAARAVMTSRNDASATITGGAVVERAAAVRVTATTTSPLEARGFGATIGLASVGRAIARATENGLTRAAVEGGAQIGDQTDPSRFVGSLTVAADTSTTARARSWAVAAGIGAGQFNEATATVLPTARATVAGAATKVSLTGNVTISAGAEGTAGSDVFSLSVGGLAAGLSNSTATESPRADASVGGGAVVQAGGDVTLRAAHNVVTGTGAGARAESPSVAVVGLGGATPTAVSSPVIQAFVAPGATVSGARAMTVESLSTSGAAADADAIFGGGIGAGTSTPAAITSGTIRALLDGTVIVGGPLIVTSQATNIANTTGAAVAGGLVAGVGVSASTTVAPTVQAALGNDSQAAAITSLAGIDVSAVSIGDADAEARGAVGGVVGIGITRATAAVTPRVSAVVGRFTNVLSFGGISLSSRHNTAPSGAATGHGARASATAAAGGVVAIETCQATATSDATVEALGNPGATIKASQAVTLRATADNTAVASADGVAGGVVAVGGARSSATANGTTRAQADAVAGLEAGGALTLFAQGTNAVSAVSFAASGGVVSVPGTNSAAVARPRIVAAVSATQPVTVGGTADIRAVALGDVTADARGYGGGLVQVGTSRAAATWQPTVDATVGGGTAITAGGDISIQAMNNFDANGQQQPLRRVRADATATGGGLVSIESTRTELTVDSAVNARIGPQASLTAGRDLLVISRSRNNLVGTGDGRSGGLVALGSVVANGLMSSVTRAQTDDATSWAPTRIAAGRAVNVTAFSDNAADVRVTGGAGGLFAQGHGQARVELRDPLTRARLGAFTVTPCERPYCEAALQVLAQNVVSLRAESDRTVAGGVVNNRSDAAAILSGGQTLAEIGPGCDIRMRQVTVVADDAFLSAHAFADAVVPFNLAGTNTANSQADLGSVARVQVFAGAKLCGSQQVSLIAQTQVARTYSRARTDTTGLTGTLISNAGSNKNVNATVVTATGSQIRTASLIVSANQPASDPNGYVRLPETNANTVTNWVVSGVQTICNWVVNVLCLGGLLCDPVQVCQTFTTYVQQILGAGVNANLLGSETVTNTVQMNAAVTISPVSCCCDQTIKTPRLIVDATGRVVALEGLAVRDGGTPLAVGDTVASERIVVEPIVNPFVGRVEIAAWGGSVEGFSEIDFDPTFAVLIDNASAKQLVIQGIATFNTEAPPTITYVASSGQATWRYALQPARETSVVVSSTSPTGGDIILEGDLLTPRGLVTIETAGGDIVAGPAGGEILAQAVVLVADQGTIGGVGAPLQLVFPINDLPPVGIVRAAGRDGVYLTAQAPASTGDPIAFVLGGIASAAGDVELLVRDATREPEDCGCEGEKPNRDPVPAASTVTIRDIVAGGNVRVTAGSSSAVATEIVVEGNVVAAGTVTLAATGSLTQIWTGAGRDGRWSNPANWQGGVIPQAGARLFFPAAASGAVSTNDLPAGTSFAAITVQDGGPRLAGNAVALAARDGAGLWLPGTGDFALPVVLAQPTTIGVSAGSLALLGSIDTAGHALTIDGSGSTVTFAAPVTGTGRLVVAGGSTVVLAAANSFAGGTLVSAGTLLVGAGGKDGTLPGDVVNNGTLAFNRSDDHIHAGVISGSGRVVNVGAGMPLLTGANTYAGGTLIDTRLAAGGATALGTGPVTIAAGGVLVVHSDGSVPFDLAVGALIGEVGSGVQLGANTLTVGGDGSSTHFAGVIEGTGDLVKVGGGDLRLSGISTYTGATVVAAGSLSVDVIASATGSNIGNPTRPLVLGGATSEGTLFYGGETTRFPGNVLVGPGGGRLLTRFCGRTLTLGGALGVTNVTGRLTVGGEGTIVLEGGVNLGAGSLAKVGAGRLRLAADSSFTGGTTIDAGELVAESAAALGDGPVSVGDGGRLRIGGPGTAVRATQLQLAPQGRIDVGSGSLRIAGGGYDAGGLDTALGEGRITGDSGGVVGLSFAGASGEAVMTYQANEPPSAVTFINTVPSLPEGTSTAERIRVADVVITDDAVGDNVLILTGPDASFFEVVVSAGDRLAATLYLKAGTQLDLGAKSSYSVTVLAGDPTLAGAVPDPTATFTLMVVPVEEPAPVTVTGVYVRGSAWVAGYLDRTPFTTVDGAALGWQLRDGAAQLTGAASVSWSNVNVISVRFDQPISQPAADALKLVFGTAGGSQTIVPTAAPTLLAGGTIVQWTLPAMLATGRYVISIAAGGITNAAGTATLDGEWTTSTSTFATGSGDGVAGGTFSFFFNVLVGNVNGDTVINAGDISSIRTKLTSPLSTPLASDTDFRLDVDGSNTLTAADISRIRPELTGPLGTSLSSLPPVTAPAESTPGSSGAFAALADADDEAGDGTLSSGLSANAWAWYGIEDGLKNEAKTQ